MINGKSLYLWMHRLLLLQVQSPISWEISSGIQIFQLLCHVLQLFSLSPVAWKNIMAGFRAAYKCPQSPKVLSVFTAHLPPSSLCNEIWQVSKLQDSHVQLEMTPEGQVRAPSHLCSAVLSFRREPYRHATEIQY